MHGTQDSKQAGAALNRLDFYGPPGGFTVQMRSGPAGVNSRPGEMTLNATTLV